MDRETGEESLRAAMSAVSLLTKFYSGYKEINGMSVTHQTGRWVVKINLKKELDKDDLIWQINGTTILYEVAIVPKSAISKGSK